MKTTTLLRAAPVAAVGLLFMIGCGGPAPDGDPLGNGSHDPPPVNVTVMKLEPSSLTEKLVLTGKVAPWVEVEVSAELGGTVQEIGFEKGQYVKKGQVLARVGTDLFTAALNEAQAALEEAEANYNRAKELFARQAVPRQELVTYTSRYHAAQARLEVAKLRAQRSVIDAPVSGMAISRHVDVGEVASPGALITSIHDISRVKVELGIPETDIAAFRVGGEAALEVDAYPGQSFEGRIHFIGPAASEKNRSFPSEVDVDNRGGELRAGMIARVFLVKRRFDDAIVVPRDALLDRDRGSVAFVGVGDRAEERQVILGPGEGNRVVIEEGLSLGDALIVAGHRNLVDGQPIRVVN